MQVLHNGVAPQVKQVLANASIARPPPLPLPNMAQPMFHHDALTQFGTSQRRQLSLAQFPEQSLIRVDGDVAPMCAGGTALAQRARCTGRHWKKDDPTGC